MNLFFNYANNINMKKLILYIILLFPLKIYGIENIMINNETLSPLFDNAIKEYNYFTESNEVKIEVISSKNEQVSGYGIFKLENKETIFNISSSKYGKFKITVFKNYEKSLDSKILSLDIKGYDLNFDSNIHEYDLNINDEEMLEIDYELSNDSSKVIVEGNGNFNNSKNIIKIKIDSKDEYIINVYKTQKVSKTQSKKVEVKKLSYIKKEIIKYIIITISCILILLFYMFIFNKKIVFRVLPNTLRK